MCAYNCRAPGCGANCTGESCAQFCDKPGCGAGCEHTDCAASCYGEGCGAGCNGMFCATECHARGCGVHCVGLNCKSNCRGDGCGFNSRDNDTAPFLNSNCDGYILETHCTHLSPLANLTCAWTNETCHHINGPVPPAPTPPPPVDPPPPPGPACCHNPDFLGTMASQGEHLCETSSLTVADLLVDTSPPKMEFACHTAISDGTCTPRCYGAGEGCAGWNGQTCGVESRMRVHGGMIYGNGTTREELTSASTWSVCVYDHGNNTCNDVGTCVAHLNMTPRINTTHLLVEPGGCGTPAAPPAAAAAADCCNSTAPFELQPNATSSCGGANNLYAGDSIELVYNMGDIFVCEEQSSGLGLITDDTCTPGCLTQVDTMGMSCLNWTKEECGVQTRLNKHGGIAMNRSGFLPPPSSIEVCVNDWKNNNCSDVGSCKTCRLGTGYSCNTESAGPEGPPVAATTPASGANYMYIPAGACQPLSPSNVTPATISTTAPPNSTTAPATTSNTSTPSPPPPGPAPSIPTSCCGPDVFNSSVTGNQVCGNTQNGLPDYSNAEEMFTNAYWCRPINYQGSQYSYTVLRDTLDGGRCKIQDESSYNSYGSNFSCSLGHRLSLYGGAVYTNNKSIPVSTFLQEYNGTNPIIQVCVFKPSTTDDCGLAGVCVNSTNHAIESSDDAFRSYGPRKGAFIREEFPFMLLSHGSCSANDTALTTSTTTAAPATTPPTAASTTTASNATTTAQSGSGEPSSKSSANTGVIVGSIAAVVFVGAAGAAAYNSRQKQPSGSDKQGLLL